MPTSLTQSLAASLLALALAQSLLLAVALLLVRRDGGARRSGSMTRRLRWPLQ